MPLQKNARAITRVTHRLVAQYAKFATLASAKDMGRFVDCRSTEAGAPGLCRFFVLERGQTVRLILGDQRIDDLVQLIARDDAIELVESQVDAVVG